MWIRHSISCSVLFNPCIYYFRRPLLMFIISLKRYIKKRVLQKVAQQGKPSYPPNFLLASRLTRIHYKCQKKEISNRCGAKRTIMIMLMLLKSECNHYCLHINEGEIVCRNKRTTMWKQNSINKQIRSIVSPQFSYGPIIMRNL